MKNDVRKMLRDRVSVAGILADSSRDPGGLTGLGLQHFTETDRLTVMVTLLSDPEIFMHTVEEMQAMLSGNMQY